MAAGFEIMRDLRANGWIDFTNQPELEPIVW